jgi:hypothetical protein
MFAVSFSLLALMHITMSYDNEIGAPYAILITFKAYAARLYNIILTILSYPAKASVFSKCKRLLA